MKKKVFRVVSFILVIAMSLSCVAFATTEPPITRASSYLNSYGAYCYAEGNGDVGIYFNVSGNGTQNYLGVSTIALRESADNGSTWTTVKTYSYVNYPNMIDTNCASMMTQVYYYQGHAGYRYYAILNFWGGSSLSVGDSRSYGTSVIVAR